MTELDFSSQNCENCAFLGVDDTCMNPDSVYHGRPAVYREGDQVVQTGWCEGWEDAQDAG